MNMFIILSLNSKKSLMGKLPNVNRFVSSRGIEWYPFYLYLRLLSKDNNKKYYKMQSLTLYPDPKP